MTSHTPKSKLPLFAGILAGVAALVVAGFWGGRALARSSAQLPVATYLANARGLAGNRYGFQARIERQLDNRPGVGRLILARDTATGSPVPFLDGGLAPSFNPEPGQLYQLTVQVAPDGLLELSAARKR